MSLEIQYLSYLVPAETLSKSIFSALTCRVYHIYVQSDTSYASLWREAESLKSFLLMLSNSYFRVRLYSIEYWCQDQSPSYRIKHTSRTSTGWLVSAWWHMNDRHLFSVVTGCHRNKNSYCIRRYHPRICLRIADEPKPTATTYTSLNFPHPPYNSIPFPTSPSFSSVPFPYSPHPQHLLPSL